MNEQPHYSMIIEWSNEDQTFVVSFPEWEATGLYFVHIHGATYEEAVKNGEEVLADLAAMAKEEGKPLPAPRVFAATV